MTGTDVTVLLLVRDARDADLACETLLADSPAPRRVVLVGPGAAGAHAAGDPRVVALPALAADCRGLAAALGAVSTGWIAAAGPSCVPRPGWLTELAGGLGAVEGAVCAGGRVFTVLGARTTAGWTAPGVPIAEVTWHGSVRSHFGDRTLDARAERVDFVDGRAMLVPADILRGLIAEMPGLSPAGCGLLVGAWVHRNGGTCVYVPRAVVVESTAAAPGAADAERRRRAEALGFDTLSTLLRRARGPGDWLRAAVFLVVGQRASPGVIAWPLYARRAGGPQKWKAAFAGRRRALEALRRLRARQPSLRAGP